MNGCLTWQKKRDIEAGHHTLRKKKHFKKESKREQRHFPSRKMAFISTRKRPCQYAKHRENQTTGVSQFSTRGKERIRAIQVNKMFSITKYIYILTAPLICWILKIYWLWLADILNITWLEVYLIVQGKGELLSRMKWKKSFAMKPVQINLYYKRERLRTSTVADNKCGPSNAHGCAWTRPNTVTGQTLIFFTKLDTSICKP